jgi:hypothetical protein
MLIDRSGTTIMASVHGKMMKGLGIGLLPLPFYVYVCEGNVSRRHSSFN